MSHNPSGFDTVERAWRDRHSVGFDRWVRQVAQAMRDSDLTLEAAASGLAVTPATFEAVLQLDQMEDADLGLLADCTPPPTTWFMFASATREQIIGGLAALKSSDGREVPSQVVRRTLHLDDDKELAKALRELAGAVYSWLAEKATRYNALNVKARGALKNFGKIQDSRHKTGKELTDPQIAYAEGMIREMISSRVVTRHSQDGDQENCDLILSLFGA